MPAIDALVLRKTAWRDADLIVDLLTRDHGRVAALARGARRSRKRFGGALEIGTRLAVHLSQGGRGGRSLTDCDVIRPLRAIREDLDRIQHLSYVLEIARLTSREGEADPGHFGMIDGYIEALEASEPRSEALALWEIALLSHLGYALRLGRCVRSGQPGDALSPRYGGAIATQAVDTPDALPITVAGMEALVALSQGDRGVAFDATAAPLIRVAFAGLWQVVTGHPLRTAAFLR